MNLTEMIENKVEVRWSVESTQSLVAGSEDCEVRVEVLSVRSLSPHQPAELQSGSLTQITLSFTQPHLTESLQPGESLQNILPPSRAQDDGDHGDDDDDLGGGAVQVSGCAGAAHIISQISEVDDCLVSGL